MYGGPASSRPRSCRHPRLASVLASRILRMSLVGAARRRLQRRHEARRAAARSVHVGVARIDCLSSGEAVERICDLARSGDWSQMVVTPNIQHVVNLERSVDFREAYASAALSLPDGWPVAIASRWFGATGQQRVTGADLLPAVCDAAARRALSVGFMGGQPTAAELCAKRLAEDFGGLDVVFVDPAPVGFDSCPETRRRLLAGIAERRPDILFVGLGSPLQEMFVHRNKPMARVVVCVGAALDFSAGLRPRAPVVVRRIGLEWLFRIMVEPRRLWRRYAEAGPAFVRIVWKQRCQRATKSGREGMTTSGGI